jgi:hypothetical protein
MEKLYVGKKQSGYEIPEEIVKKYKIKTGDISPYTRLKVISESTPDEDIDIKKVSSGGENFLDIKKVSHAGNEIDIMKVPKDDEIDIKKVSR